MAGPHLSEAERAIYDAARAEALAERWRTDADLRERDGGDASLCRQYVDRYEAEAAEAWRAFTEAKGRGDAEWGAEAATWAEAAADKLKSAGDDAKQDYEKRVEAGIGDDDPQGDRLLELLLLEADLDKLVSGLRRLAETIGDAR